MNQIKRGALLSYFSLGLSNIIGITYTPFMLRMLGQSEYGLYSLVFSVVTTLALLDCGFGPAIVRFTTQFKNEGDNKLPSMLGMFFVLYTLIGIISLMLCALLAYKSNVLFSDSMSSEELAKAKIMIWIIGVYISVGFPFSVFSSIITAYENFVFLKILNILKILLIPIVMIPLLLLGYKSVAMAIVLVSVGVLVWFLNVWFCISRLKIKIVFGKIDVAVLKEISAFSAFVLIKMILDRILWSSGQFILGAVSGTIAVAVFSIALQMKGYYEGFARAIDGMFLPKCTTLTLTDNRNEISDLFIKIGRLQTHVLGYIMCIYILFGNAFIYLWAGSSYEESYYFSLMIMIPYTVPLIQSLGNTILQAYNKLKFQSFIYLVMSGLTVGLSVYLGHLFDSWGCVIALCISITIGEIIIMNIYYSKVIKIDIKGFWKEFLKIAFPLFIIVIVAKIVLQNVQIMNWSNLLMNVSIFSLIYVPITYRFLLNNYERNILKRIVTKVKHIR